MKNKIVVAGIFSFLVVGGLLGIIVYRDRHSLVNGFMTKKQLREDYEFFWDYMENTYPYIDVCSRKGADLATIKKQYNGLLYDIKDEYEYLVFYAAIMGKITQYKFPGHLGCFLDATAPTITISQNNEIKKSEYQEYPEIAEFYNRVNIQANKMTTRIYNDILKRFHFDTTKKIPNIKFYDINEILESKSIRDEIAYINFKSFYPKSSTTIEYNKFYDLFEKTLRKHKDAKHLIIDLRENCGGYSELWEKGIVAHLSTKLINSEIPTLAKKENKYYKLFINKTSPDYMCLDKAFSECKLSEKNKNDKKKFDTIVNREINITPFKPIPFKGKLWVLIGKNTASAAEEFVCFLKRYKIKNNAYEIPVTIVGNPSYGKAFGFERLRIKFPNSGLLLISDLGYVLNTDGSCMAEEGVKPDIESKGMDVLRKCLLLIEEEK